MIRSLRGVYAITAREPLGLAIVREVDTVGDGAGHGIDHVAHLALPQPTWATLGLVCQQ